MRCYLIFPPGTSWTEGEPQYATSIKGLRDLPEGTRIQACFYGRDGSLDDNFEVPIVNGKPKMGRHSIHTQTRLRPVEVARKDGQS